MKILTNIIFLGLAYFADFICAASTPTGSGSSSTGENIPPAVGGQQGCVEPDLFSSEEIDSGGAYGQTIRVRLDDTYKVQDYIQPLSTLKVPYWMLPDGGRGKKYYAFVKRPGGIDMNFWTMGHKRNNKGQSVPPGRAEFILANIRYIAEEFGVYDLPENCFIPDKHVIVKVPDGQYYISSLKQRTLPSLYRNNINWLMQKWNNEIQE